MASSLEMPRSFGNGLGIYSFQRPAHVPTLMILINILGWGIPRVKGFKLFHSSFDTALVDIKNMKHNIT